MAFFDTLTRVISETGHTVVNKTKDVGEIAKLTARVSELERKMDQTYKIIGKLYVEHYGDDPDEVFKQAVASIKDKQRRIAGYKEDIRVLRGIRRCSACGADVEANSSFCSKCGAKVEPANVVADVDGIFADDEAAYEDPEDDIEVMFDCEVEEDPYEE